MTNRLALFSIVSFSLVACGGASSPPPHDADASSAKPSDDPPPATATATATAAAGGDHDTDEGDDTSAPAPAVAGVTSLEMLLKKGDTSGFPSSSEDDATCLQAAGIVGDSVKDFTEIAKHCGTNTGMKPMSKVMTKKIAALKTDTYDFKMLGGFCYRFFAVGGPTMQNFSFRVERPNGAFMSGTNATDATAGVAVLDPKAPWCKTHDREFHLVVEAKGKSAGGYTVGIFARPKK